MKSIAQKVSNDVCGGEYQAIDANVVIHAGNLSIGVLSEAIADDSHDGEQNRDKSENVHFLSNQLVKGHCMGILAFVDERFVRPFGTVLKGAHWECWKVGLV